MPGQEDPEKAVTLAYTVQAKISLGGQMTDVAYMHMCEQGYDMPHVSDIGCSSLGSTVSSKMNTMGGIFIHEYM